MKRRQFVKSAAVKSVVAAGVIPLAAQANVEPTYHPGKEELQSEIDAQLLRWLLDVERTGLSKLGGSNYYDLGKEKLS